jgi:G3E family GTPase
MLGLHTTLFSDVHHHSDAEEHDTHHHQKEVDVYTLQISSQDRTFDIEQFKSCVQHLSNDSYYRIKGIVNFGDGFHLVNMAFGRFEAPLPLKQYEGNLTRLSFVGVGISVQEIAAGLSVDAACISKVE